MGITVGDISKGLKAIAQASGLNLSHALPTEPDQATADKIIAAKMAKQKQELAKKGYLEGIPGSNPKIKVDTSFGPAVKYYSTDFVKKTKPILMMKPGTMVPVSSSIGTPIPINSAITGSLKAPYTPPYKVANDQLLIQRVGIASNLNVTFQHAFSTKGENDVKVRMLCNRCGGDKIFYDMTAFKESAGGLVDSIMTFCTAHRHEDQTTPIDVMTPVQLAVAAKASKVMVKEDPQGRHFRED